MSLKKLFITAYGEIFTMPAIQPKGEKIRQAVKWISEGLKEDENKSVLKLIEEAGTRFNLSPKDEDFLRSFYK